MTAASPPPHNPETHEPVPTVVSIPRDPVPTTLHQSPMSLTTLPRVSHSVARTGPRPCPKARSLSPHVPCVSGSVGLAARREVSARVQDTRGAAHARCPSPGGVGHRGSRLQKAVAPRPRSVASPVIPVSFHPPTPTAAAGPSTRARRSAARPSRRVRRPPLAAARWRGGAVAVVSRWGGARLAVGVCQQGGGVGGGGACNAVGRRAVAARGGGARRRRAAR